jgi:hypothetical protein
VVIAVLPLAVVDEYTERHPRQTAQVLELSLSFTINNEKIQIGLKRTDY